MYGPSGREVGQVGCLLSFGPVLRAFFLSGKWGVTFRGE